MSEYERIFTKEEAIAYEREMITQGTLEFMFGTYTGDIFNGVLPIRKGRMEYKNGLTLEHSLYGADSRSYYGTKDPVWSDDNLFLFNHNERNDVYTLHYNMWDDQAWNRTKYSAIDYERIKEEGKSFYFDYRNKVANECHRGEVGDDWSWTLFRGIPAGYPKFSEVHFDKFIMPENDGERIEYTNVNFTTDGRSGSYYHVSGDNSCDGFGDFSGTVCLGYPVEHKMFLHLRDLAKEKGVYGSSKIDDADGYAFESHGNIRQNYVYGHLLLENGDLFRGYILLPSGRGNEDESQWFLDPVMLGGQYFNCRKKVKAWVDFDADEELYNTERRVGYRIDCVFDGELYNNYDDFYNGNSLVYDAVSQTWY